MSDQPPTLEQHIATAQHLAEFSTEATDPGAATSSIAHSLCALNLQVAQLTGIVSDGVTAIQQHLPLATTDRRHTLALQEQGVAAIRDLTEVMRANGAARNAVPEQPEPPAAPEGRYLHGRCGCAEGSGVYWGVDIATGRHVWLLVSRPDTVLYHHCPGCGAHLLWPGQCAAIGQPAGTAVAFAPVTVSDERLRADRDVLATVLRQVVSEMSAVTEIARRCGVAPTRLHELLAHAGGGE